jgi:hypothetical protein
MPLATGSDGAAHDAHLAAWWRHRHQAHAAAEREAAYWRAEYERANRDFWAAYGLGVVLGVVAGAWAAVLWGG